MFLRILKLVFMIAATFALGAFAFLHGFTAWRAGQVTVRRRGAEPFVAAADGPFPLTFATEVWGLMIIGAAVVLLGVAMIVSLLIATPAERRARLDRIGAARHRASSDMDMSWKTALAIIGAVVALVFYLAFRIHAQ
ncbi:hypothetical protein ACSFBM_25290 [Variovorax sp. GB1R11]|uniref:hypothetical protein n=1 Tax=Variovorax sp. GB1R11 TaxID=3443741 RepID=UPI003F457216